VRKHLALQKPVEQNEWPFWRAVRLALEALL
jgi:hypothetical protein